MQFLKIVLNFWKDKITYSPNLFNLSFKGGGVSVQWKNNVVNNQNGSTIVIAMLVLAVLTILGISSINTSTIELQIVRNERIYQQNFYMAEAAALEGLELLESATESELDDKTYVSFIWLKKVDSNLDMGDVDNWDTTTNAAVSAVSSDARYAIVEESVALKSSLDMTAASQLYDYVARGQSASDNGRVMIEIGYRKRH